MLSWCSALLKLDHFHLIPQWSWHQGLAYFPSPATTFTRPQDTGGVFLTEGSARSGGLKRSGTFSGVGDRATALITILRWPALWRRGYSGPTKQQWTVRLEIEQMPISKRAWSSTKTQARQFDSFSYIRSFSVNCPLHFGGSPLIVLQKHKRIWYRREFLLNLHFIPRFFSSLSMLTP